MCKMCICVHVLVAVLYYTCNTIACYRKNFVFILVFNNESQIRFDDWDEWETYRHWPKPSINLKDFR